MRHYKKIKYTVWALVLFFLINIIPHVVVRILAASNAVQSFELAGIPMQFNGTITVAVYNIAHGRGGKYGGKNWNGESGEERERRLLSIAHLLKQQDVDVVILNEVDFDSDWSHNLNQAEMIAKKADFPYRVEQRNYSLYHPFFKLQFGNAILSKYPIDNARLLEFMPLSMLEKMVFGNHDGVVVDLVLNENKKLSIVALHLEVRDGDSRLKTFSILQQLASTTSIPTILAGDFNSVKGAGGNRPSIIDKLTDIDGVGYYPNASSNESSYTFPSKNPVKTLDWILVPSSIKILQGQVLKVNWSDHLPLIVDLKL
ncbi:MAG: endonuclease/exonuclease/phosphatase family metal-dependent hydrolase [Kiritimatiellia bacterium]|jgi:endonuclease/exonuclease/phosphatase family metal-dependent hydrolase